MKKLLLATVVLGMTLVGLSTQAKAQFYSPYAYNNNAYLNYAIASQRAKALRRGTRSSTRSHKSRRARHARRVRRYSRSR